MIKFLLLLINNQNGFIPWQSICNNLAETKNIILHTFKLNSHRYNLYRLATFLKPLIKLTIQFYSKN